MIRWTVIRGKRIPAPVAPIPSAYMAVAGNVVKLVEAVYLELIGHVPEDSARDDALPRNLRANRPAIVEILRNTDRARELSEHGLSVLVDNFLQFLDFHSVLDNLGNSVVRDANQGFDKLIQAAGDGRKLKAQIAVIDHRAAKDTARFLNGFRQKNLGLIRTMVAKQVENTENALRNTYGLPPRDIAKAVQSATGITESHAELVARDQTLKMNSQVQEFRARSLGADYYTWVTSNDERVRGRPGGKWANAQSNHWRLHGKRFQFSNPPVTNEKKNIRLNPGMDFQCRCTAAPDLSHIFGE